VGHALPGHPGLSVLLCDLAGGSRWISCSPARQADPRRHWPRLLPGSRDLASAPDAPAFLLRGIWERLDLGLAWESDILRQVGLSPMESADCWTLNAFPGRTRLESGPLQREEK
jgi:hypothetical protein